MNLAEPRIPSTQKMPPPERPGFFASIYHVWFDHAVTWAIVMGVPMKDAKDVAQNAFIEIHASLHRYDPSRPLKPWLAAIVMRRAIDHLRRIQRRRMVPIEEHDTLGWIDPRADPERGAQAREALQLLVELLQEPPEEQREVLVMHVIEEIEIPDVAEACSILENTVRSRLHRARVAFRAACHQRGVAPGDVLVLWPARIGNARAIGGATTSANAAPSGRGTSVALVAAASLGVQGDAGDAVTGRLPSA